MSWSNPGRSSPRFFYGWWIVLLSFLGGLMGRLDLWVFGLFIVPMQAELGWSRTAITGAVTLSMVCQAVAGLAMGPLLDRKHGARLMIVVGGTVAGAGLVVAGMATSILHFYLAYGLVLGVATVTYSDLMGQVMVPKWFVRKRGRAVALASLGFPMAAPLLVPGIQAVIAIWGWRSGFWALGLATWVLIVPLGAWRMRRSPEDLGLRPDGEVVAPSWGAASPSPGEAPDVSWRWHQAAHTPTLWLLVAAFSLAMAAVMAISVHRIPYLIDVGLSPALAAAVITVSGSAAIATKMAWGFLMERFPVRYLLVACFAAISAGVVIMLGIAAAPLAFLWALWWGGNVSGVVPLQSVVFATYYGRGFLGRIRGRVQPPIVLAQALAPLLPALIQDATGSYRLAFWLFAGVLVASVVLFFLARPPGLPGPAAGEEMEATR